MRLSLAPWLGVALLAAPVLTTAQPAPALGDALKTLLNEHPAAAAARQQVVAAEAQARAADHPLYNPELDVEYERAEVNTTTVGVSQTVDWADKRAASAGVGARALAAARAELDRVRQQIALSWLRALSQKAAAEATQALAERRRKLTERFVNLAQRRHTAGDLRRSDLNLARLAVLQARVEERQASAGLAAARGELQDAAGGVPGLESPPLGRVPPAPSALESELDRLPQPPPALRTARAGSHRSCSPVPARGPLWEARPRGDWAPGNGAGPRSADQLRQGHNQVRGNPLVLSQFARKRPKSCTTIVQTPPAAPLVLRCGG